MPTFREIWFEFLAWLIVAGFCMTGALSIGFWAIIRGRQIFPPFQYRMVRWTGLEIVTTLFLTRYSWPFLVRLALLHLGFFSLLSGWKLSIDSESMNSTARIQMSLWVFLFNFPLNLGTAFLVFRLGSGGQVSDLGLSIRRPRENFGLACMSWLVVTPMVFGVGVLADLAYYWLSGFMPDPHSLQKLAEESPTLMDGAIIALSSLVIGPIWEEVMFRGVLQQWLCVRDWRGHLAMGLSFFIAVGTVKALYDSSGSDDIGVGIVILSPLLFVLVSLPGYIYVGKLAKQWIPDQNAIRGIYATALLFGMVHSSNWPTPIPLFVLGLALGYLAYRTQTLLAAILLHSLFNLVAGLTLLLPHVYPDCPKGSEDTSALSRSVPTATSTRVPGSWQVR
jgi:membrane protease YdiL (CAAX protease family)